MLDVHVVYAHRVRRYSVALANVAGWELKLEEDHAVCWQEIYADWHRVERRMTMMLKEVAELLEQGWAIAPASQ